MFIMFTGSIGKTCLQHLDDLLRNVDHSAYPAVYVGCSGNFTFDQLASKAGFKVYSNDVSLYSRVVASILLDTPFEFQCINSELQEVFSTWEHTRYTPLIQVMYALRLSEFASRKNDFEQMQWDAWIEENPYYFAKTMKGFEEKKPFDYKIEDFFFGDFKQHIENTPDNSTAFLYAPTYKGGYEKIFKYIESSFEYQRPAYDMFDPTTAGAYYADLLSRKRAFIYADIKYPEIPEEYLKGMVETIGTKPVYLFSSVQSAKSFCYKQQDKIVKKTYELLPYDAELPDNTVFTIGELKAEMVYHYKHLFMSAKVDYSDAGDLFLGFFADGKLFGLVSLSKMDGDLVFQHSDFVVNSGIDRLSKLLLYFLRSKEIREIVKKKMVKDFTGLYSTVYTDKPVSMKYRGVYKLIEELKNPRRLRYGASFTDFNLQECYQRWKKRKPLSPGKD